MASGVRRSPCDFLAARTLWLRDKRAARLFGEAIPRKRWPEVCLVDGLRRHIRGSGMIAPERSGGATFETEAAGEVET